MSDKGVLVGNEHSIIAAYRQMVIEVEQVLGRALGYPLYADDQKNFPGTTEADGVCVGDHVPASLADEAAREIAKLRTENDGLHERQAEAKKLLESSLSVFERAENELVEKDAEIARLEKELADLTVQYQVKAQDTPSHGEGVQQPRRGRGEMTYQWSDKRLWMVAECIVAGKCGMYPVYTVLKEMRDGYAAELAKLRSDNAELSSKRTPPLWDNDRIDDIVDNHIFLDNGTATYRVQEDRAVKYMRQMRDDLMDSARFWEKYGIARNLDLVDTRAALWRLTQANAELAAEVERLKAEGHPLPDDVGDAIAGLIGFACNPSHMDEESLAMAYTAAKWLAANARPQGKDDSNE